jgi:microcin C transport system permease protein
MVLGSFAVTAVLTKTRFWKIQKAVRVDGPCQGPEQTVGLYKHVFRNALIPIITGFQPPSLVLLPALLIEPFST